MKFKKRTKMTLFWTAQHCGIRHVCGGEFFFDDIDATYGS